MLDTSRNDEQLTFSEPNGAIWQIDLQFTLYHQKRLVRFGVIVPDELTLHADELELHVVHLRYDSRLPLV